MALNAEEAERRAAATTMTENEQHAGTTRPTLRVQPLTPVAQGSVRR
jgi:hypothetical protein